VSQTAVLRAHQRPAGQIRVSNRWTQTQQANLRVLMLYGYTLAGIVLIRGT
jgi:hypothetical protein